MSDTEDQRCTHDDPSCFNEAAPDSEATEIWSGQPMCQWHYETAVRRSGPP